MIKKRLFALTVMLCIIAVGVVYGKWTKRLNLGLETRSGILKYEIGNISDCKVSVINNELTFDIPAEQLEFTEGSNELVIKVPAEKVNGLSDIQENTAELNIVYAARPSDKNTIYSVDVDKKPRTHIAEVFSKVEETQNDATQDSKLSEMISNKIECITETSSEYKTGEDDKYLEISHKTRFEDYEYKPGDIITIEYDDIIEQKNNDEFTNKTEISTTNCLWNQKLKLQCRILITE